MGYRYCDKPKPKPEDMMPVFDMTNNEFRIWSIPCFYFTVDKPIDWHSRDLHDHLGWPDPDHPDNICQLPWEVPHHMSPDAKYKYVDMKKTKRIHLLSDYELTVNRQIADSSIEVVFDEVEDEDTASIVSPNAWIDDIEDWVIRLGFNPKFDQFSGDPIERVFNAYLVKKLWSELTQSDEEVDKDLIVRGKLVVFPG